MPGTPDLSQLLAALDGVSAQMARAQAAALDEPLRRQLAGLATRLRQIQGQFKTEYPKAVAAQQARMAEITRRARATLDRVAQLRQQAEEADKARAAPPPPPPPEEPVDPGLGRKLRDELLERFGNLPPGKRGTERKPADAVAYTDLSARDRLRQ